MLETERCEAPTEPAAQPPHAVESLELYDKVARGEHDALKPARIPSDERAHGVTLSADTYIAANPETGERARIVATIKKDHCK